MKRSLFGISMLTIAGLYFLLSAVIILLAILTNVPVLYGILASIIILIVQFLVSPFITDLTMKWFYRVKFDYELPEYLKKFIETVCDENNMAYPRIGYIDDGAPNAFTYGHTKNNARVIITRGILEILDEEEVKNVVAHELGHASHYDMLFMTVAQLVPLVLYAIYEICLKSDNNSKSNNNDNNSYGAIIGLIAYILYVISNYILLALSRTREYYADSFALEATKNPNALASALVKVGYGLSTAEKNGKHSAASSNALGIFDSKTSKSLVVTSMDDGEISKDNIKQAMKWEQWNIWAKWYEFNSTHPLISKRLLAISSRSSEFNQEPYITFDLKKEESYVDDFLIEALISFLPGIILLIGIIATIIMIGMETVSILLIIGVTMLLFGLTSLLKFSRKYPNKNYKSSNVKDLLSEVKVSHITAIPCSLEGTIIGRGNPGCIFNEDFVLKDETGIIFLDYNQPLKIVNKIFALFLSKDYFDKKIKITGWYRRSPVPYIELKNMEIDGKIKKIYTYRFQLILYIILIVMSILFIGIGL